MTTLTLVLTAVGSVLLLLFLVMKARMHAFLALMVVSMGAGLFSGMPLDKIAATMEKGMGGTLGFLAVVVALGAMFGKILHETGAVDQIAVKMLKSFGHSRAHYAIGLAGLVCALPLFFEVAIVLLISVAFSMARHTGTNLVKLVIPLFAGVAAAAAFLVPGPAPMLLASQMNADFGWMILIGLCAAIPGMIIAGPLWGNFISRYVELHIPDDISEPHLGEGKMPSFGFSLSLILLPLVLVGLKTIAARFVPEGSTAYEWFEFIGHPFTAILVACLVAIYGLAMRQGMPKDKVMEICGHALQPAGIILLVIGAGGVFKQVLVDSGVGPALGEALTGMGLPIAITCFVLAAAVRIIQFLFFQLYTSCMLISQQLHHSLCQTFFAIHTAYTSTCTLTLHLLQHILSKNLVELVRHTDFWIARIGLFNALRIGYHLPYSSTQLIGRSPKGNLVAIRFAHLAPIYAR